MSILSSIVGSLICIGAGVYLLLHGSPPIQIGDQAGESWLAIIAHGMGAYFIGKGILLAPQTWNLGHLVDLTNQLVRNTWPDDEGNDDTGE
ncbi:MAG TPA: hypothetical protein VKT78_00965 [Fimbriimonadaceae bacterium]|nr:hypothetical protein [Fimbriimonadaceae bacterium]